MNKTRESNYGDDLISELPDEILHYILSFLDMQYVMKTSLLSRRWRNLWKSLPYLNFHPEVPDDDTDTPSYRNFNDFVTRVLSLQNGTNNNINTFRLVLQAYLSEICFDTCMPIAVTRNVQVLDIRTHYYAALTLPPCIFTCKSLTMLKLDMTDALKTAGSWDLPDSMSLPSLKTLHLISFVLYDGDDVEKFISSCPVLETLIMSYCMLEKYNYVTLLTISAPQLKNFELDSLYLGDPFNPPYPASSKVKVWAPNLTWLRYEDFTFNVKFLEDIPCLVKAEISKGLYLQMPEVLEEEIESVIQCFRQFHNIRSLTVDMLLIELVCSARVGSESWLTPFCNLRLLNLATTLSICQSCAIAYLLDNCPNVETLVLEMGTHSSCLHCSQSTVREDLQDVDCCEAKMPSQCMLRHLKFVEVRKLRGSANELEFLKFLLNNATVLEQINIFTYDKDSSISSTRLRGFRESLLAFPRASSVEIIVH